MSAHKGYTPKAGDVVTVTHLGIGNQAELEQRFIVLDHHPRAACWWLQDETTGQVHPDLYAHAGVMTKAGSAMPLPATPEALAAP